VIKPIADSRDSQLFGKVGHQRKLKLFCGLFIFCKNKPALLPPKAKRDGKASNHPRAMKCDVAANNIAIAHDGGAVR